jgi:cytochrome c oxidase cbb3-type subunit 1
MGRRGLSTPGAELAFRDDVDLRLRADSTTRRPVLFVFTFAIFWLLVGSVFGEIASLKLHLPEWLVRQGWLTFGRVRTAHLDIMAYGWASLAMVGVALWTLPRLLHAELRWPIVPTIGAILWNVGLVIGIWMLLIGRNNGMEWLELDRYYSVPFLVVGGGCVAASLLGTLINRKAPHLYVSVWYIIGAFIWFPVIYVAGNWPTLKGAESGAANWFYAHNALGLWFAPICLAAIYYFMPKVLGRPIHSYQLSLLGFWTLAFFYALNGMHHLIGGPIPTWMITTSVVASVLMVIPIISVGVNHHMTMIGRFGALRYSPTLRFIVIGAISYTAVSLQGSFTALREVNRVTHFTHWTVAHAHVGAYAFVTFALFGAIYYIMPRLTRREWPSPALIRWHFWLVLIGISAYVIGLTIAGVFQGLALLDPDTPFQVSVDRTLWGLWVRSAAGLLLTAGHIVFAIHFIMITRGPEPAWRIPPLHEVQPVVYHGDEEEKE